MESRAEMLVREVTTAHPESLRQFERWGIDYCCGGGRPLDEACRRAGVPLEEVLAYVDALSATSPQPERDFRTRPLRELIDHLLETHHEFTRSELERAKTLSEKVARVHGASHPELVRVRDLVSLLRDELLVHMMKEERVLFPYVIALAGGDVRHVGSVSAPIACMRVEHEDAGGMLEDLRALTSHFTVPEDACGSYRALYQSLHDLDADLRVHIHLENDILFPRAIELEASGRAA